MAQAAFLLDGDLEPRVLQEALRCLVERHQILRTRFCRVPGIGVPVQVIGAPYAPPLARLGLNRLERGPREAALAELSIQELHRPFDLEHDPPLRIALASIAERRHALLLTLPALCADGPTLYLLARELAAAYAARRCGSLPGGTDLQYVQFAEWQNELLQEAAAAGGRHPWDRLDAGELAAARLPFTARSDRGFAPRALAVSLPAALAAAASAAAARFAVGAPAVPLTAWLTLLGRLTRRSEIAAGVALDGRVYDELRGLPGPYESYLPIACRPHDDASFLALLRQVDGALAKAAAVREEFFGERFHPEEGGAPSFLPFAYDFEPGFPALQAGGLSWTLWRRFACGERFEVKLCCRSGGDALEIELHYDAGACRRRECERLAGLFRTLLEDALSRPEAPAGELRLLDAAMRAQVLVEWSTAPPAPPAPAAARLVHEAFAARAAAAPDRVAVRCGLQSLTFGQLNARANRLARHLEALGLATEAPVAICLEATPDLIVAVLGVLEAGGAYVPLDPAHPAARRRQQLEDCGAAFLLTREALLDAGPLPSGLRVLLLETLDASPAARRTDDPESGASEASLAYILYTSGSTGLPKGVMVPHGALANYLRWCAEAYPEVAVGGAPLHSSAAFDLTVTSLFAPLLAGSSVTLIAAAGGDPPLARWLRDGAAYGLVKATPTHLEAMALAGSDGEPPPRAGVLVIGGEALLAERLSCWRRHDPGARVVNEYGPTEATVGCCAYEVPPQEAGCGPVPIGRPIAGAEVYLLDQRLEPVPPGLLGELCIGGPGLARGYLRRPELTAASFLPHPFAGRPGARLYRSGDLARHRPDGNLEFCGRLDEQVKIRGHRVELGEVQAVLQRHPAVRDAAVVVREDAPGEPRLVAYVAAGPAAALPEDGGTPYRLPNGLFVAHLNRNETDLLYRDIFEERIYFRHGIVLDGAACVFDVGANIGLFTLQVLTHAPGARVFAFEPVPALFAALRANAARYGPRVTLSPCGLAEAGRTARLTYYPRMTTMSSLYADPAADEEVARVFLRNQDQVLAPYSDDLLAGRFAAQALDCRLTTLSDAMREQRVERIDLLKLDVEKSELDVLAGIREADWGRIRQIVLEVHGEGDRLAPVTALLEEHGFGIVVERHPWLAGTGLCHVYAVRPAGESAPRISLPPPALPPSPEQLRAFVAERLPHFMVPARFVVLAALPATAGGKLDRRALPAPGAAPTAGPRLPPRSAAERLLADIWSRILGISPIGVDDNFFELGGDSILSLQVVTRANQAGLRLEPRQLFEHQTLARLAAAAEMAPAVVAASETVSGPVPLTPIQRWFFEQDQPEPHHFNQAVLAEAAPPLDAAVLAAAVAALVTRHDALRLRFARLPSGWAQRAAAPATTGVFSHLDLAALPAAARGPALATAVTALQQSLDLTRGPLLRAAFFDLGPGEPGRFLLLVHHLAVDSVSWRVLLEDLARASRQRLGGLDPRLQGGTAPFCSWAQRLAEHARAADLRREAPYWLRAGEPRASPLPLDGPAGAERNTEAGARTHRVVLEEAPTLALLGAAAQAHRARPFELVLSAVALALARWARSELVLVDLEGHGREDLFADLHPTRTVGWFTTLYPLQLRLPAGRGPAAVLHGVKEQVRRTPGRGMGYGLLRYAAGDEAIAAALRGLPQAEVSFAYFGQVDRGWPDIWPLSAPSEAELGSRSRRARRPYLLEVNARVAAGRLELAWTYSASCHQEATVEGWARDSLEVLRELLEEPAVEATASLSGDSSLGGLDPRQLERLAPGIGGIEDVYPLSHTQQGLLFHTLSSPAAGAYTVPLSCSLVGNLDSGALRRAWREMLSRHPVLRTAFVWEGLREPRQVVLDEVELPWTEEDWRGLPAADQSGRLEALLEAERSRGFELGRAPLLRLSLLRVAETVHRLVWTFHHLLLDGWSVSVLLREISSLYEAVRRGVFCQLAPAPPYRDYIAHLQRRDLAPAEAFWRRQREDLATRSRLAWPAADPAAWEGRTPALEVRLGAAATGALQALARQRRLTLSTLLEGAWALVLHGRTGDSPVVFGATVAGRPADLAGSEAMVGLFINTLPLVVTLPLAAPAAAWLEEIQDRCAQLREHDQTPLIEVQRWSGAPPGEALFETVLVVENYPAGLPLSPAGGSIAIRDVRWVDPSHYPLTLTATLGTRVTLRLSCDPLRFDPPLVRELMAECETALEVLAARPDATLRELMTTLDETRSGRRRMAQAEVGRAARSRLRRAGRRPIDPAAGSAAPAES